jgi:hypothetical protein
MVVDAGLPTGSEPFRRGPLTGCLRRPGCWSLAEVQSAGPWASVMPGGQDGTPVARRMKASNPRSGKTPCRTIMALAPYPAA